MNPWRHTDSKSAHKDLVLDFYLHVSIFITFYMFSPISDAIRLAVAALSELCEQILQAFCEVSLDAPHHLYAQTLLLHD